MAYSYSCFFKVNLILFFPFAVSVTSFAQSDHPRILVSNNDKQEIIEKIENQDWAAEIYDAMVERVDTYVERHQEDPEWILSRYQMNWETGKRYTDFISDSDGTELINWKGDAPYPTVKVSNHKRDPIAPDGYKYRVPSLEELKPYDTSSKWRMQSTGPGKEWSEADPRRMTIHINGKINSLALESAIIYWLTGDEKYADFASDILFQWARGAYFQNPVEGACRDGYFAVQSLGDTRYASLVLTYDFVHDYLVSEEYDMSYFQTVFEKMSDTAMKRGFWTNNWYAAQSTVMVYAALALNDKAKRDHYLSYYLDSDFKNGECGQLGLSTTMKTHFTEDGHWKENSGYHDMPVGHLLESAIAVENQGISVFQNYPSLFQASYAMLRYSFPNLQMMGFGDIRGWRYQSPKNLEIAIRYAFKYNHPELTGLVSSLQQLIDLSLYERKDSGWHGLLSYLPSLPRTDVEAFNWSRAFQLDFAKLYGHRNVVDKENSMMHYLHGATYNHNHANGLAMELYGKGYILGADPGTSGSYEDSVFVNYLATFASHNTVIAAGASEPSIPFKGSGGATHMDEISLSAMEPNTGEEGVSPNHSFVEANYVEPSTKTNQQRLMGIVKTSEKSGYYVDIFRSDNEISNDYIYHNIGHSVELLDRDRNKLEMRPDSIPYQSDRQSGLEWFYDIKSPIDMASNSIGVFRVKEMDTTDVFMQMLIPEQENAKVLTALGPRSHTTPEKFKDLPTPKVIVHRSGSAWNNPFATIYEPFRGEKDYGVISTKTIETESSLAVLEVQNKDNSKQIILQSDKPEIDQVEGEITLKGHYGVVSLTDSEIEYLYSGYGESLGWNGYNIESEGEINSIFVKFKEDGFIASSEKPFTLKVPFLVKNITDHIGREIGIKRVEDEGNTFVIMEAGKNASYFITK